MNLARNIATVGGLTMLSRITGLVREMAIAHFLGAGLVADAFFVAFRFPNLFRSLFAEGAFNSAFIPLFTGTLTTDGDQAARHFADQAFTFMALVLALLVGGMELAMGWAIFGLAPGFADTPGKAELAADLARICFPYLLFISLTALQAGVLNARGHFAAAAATPVLLNLVSVAGLWVLVPVTPSPGHALAWGTLAAGIVQFAWLAVVLRRAGFGLRLCRPALNSRIKTLLTRIVPGAVGAGVYQVNLVINTMIASTVANGAVSYLNYADRVNQLPLGVVGIAIGTALLPLLTRQIKAGQIDAARDSQNRGLEFALILTLPATVALFTLALPIIQVLFQRGHFTAADSAATAAALRVFTLGLPAYVLIKVLTPAFFAREDTATPVKVAGATMVVNVALNLLLSGPLAHVGMALSTALSSWFNVLVLAILLVRRGLYAPDQRLLSRSWRIVASALVMGAVVDTACRLSWGDGVAGLAALGLLAALVAGGLVLFFAAAHVSGAMRLGEVKAMMRRRPA